MAQRNNGKHTSPQLQAAHRDTATRTRGREWHAQRKHTSPQLQAAHRDTATRTRGREWHAQRKHTSPRLQAARPPPRNTATRAHTRTRMALNARDGTPSAGPPTARAPHARAARS
jgi:hypothetical protein